MKNFKEIINISISNIAWIITTIIAIGMFISVVQAHGVTIAENKAKIVEEHNRIDRIEVAITKMDVLFEKINDMKENNDKSFAEIKQDVKDIKKLASE